MKNRMSIFEAMRSIAFIAVIGFTMIACDNDAGGGLGGDLIDGDPTETLSVSSYTFIYSAQGPDPMLLREYQWRMPNDNDFKLAFENNGTISSIHCCDLLFNGNGGYLITGNILITYGNTGASHDGGPTVIQATTFTVKEDGSSFMRSNGAHYNRYVPNTGYNSLPVVLSNKLIGIWQEENGTDFVFNTDATLRIGSGEYGYLAWPKTFELLTVGPLVDGEPADVVHYRYTLKKDGKLLLRRLADDFLYTLSPVEIIPLMVNP